MSLQQIEQLPDMYDLIWVQWVLLYLTDIDFATVLQQLRRALRPKGLLIIKENCLLNKSSGWVDHRDSSLCRSDAELRNRFAEGGFGLVAQQQQQDWPDSLLPVDCQHFFVNYQTLWLFAQVLCQAGDLALRLIGTQCVCVARCMSFPLSLQCAKAQHAHSQEAHRRLESEVSVASVPRQKVRISRQRLLESAVKVMNLYSSGNALLEIEYVGEVGTGSGPTLEFYAQVAEHLRSSSPALFRQNVPAGMLFPAPWDPNWLRSADDQVAQQILERFRLLGQIVAKCIIDNRLVDIQLHPAVWRSVLGLAPLSQESLRAVDPELYSSLVNIRDMDSSKVAELCLDFTLPGYPKIELKPGGAGITVT
ncbi:unnamed protein product, partial [Durusdinium trenchii]